MKIIRDGWAGDPVHASGEVYAKLASEIVRMAGTAFSNGSSRQTTGSSRKVGGLPEWLRAAHEGQAARRPSAGGQERPTKFFQRW